MKTDYDPDSGNDHAFGPAASYTNFENPVNLAILNACDSHLLEYVESMDRDWHDDLSLEIGILVCLLAWDHESRDTWNLAYTRQMKKTDYSI